MNDTPQYIKELQLKMWLEKTPGERLYQAITDIDIMRNALRRYKLENNLPLHDLDPVGEYLKMKQQKEQNTFQKK